MDDQITVRLPRSLRLALRRASHRLRRRDSDVVRLALEAFLQTGPGGRERAADRVGDLVGALSTGTPDLARRHREYLLEALARGR